MKLLQELTALNEAKPNEQGYWNFGGSYSSDARAFVDLLADRSPDYRVDAILKGCKSYEYHRDKNYNRSYTCTFADKSIITIDLNDKSYRISNEPQRK